MTQARAVNPLEHDESGVVVSVHFGKKDFERVSKLAEAEGLSMAALIHDVVLNRVADKEALAELEKLWAEDAKLIREQGPPPCIWDVPNDDDMDEWLRE